MLTFLFCGPNGYMAVAETLTAGMVGKTVRLEFSSDWESFDKTVVFRAGDVIRDVINGGELVEIPAECLAVANVQLHVGVYGVAGDRVTPTIIVPGPYILPGADPSGDESTNPELPVWAQLQRQIKALQAAGPGGGGSIIIDPDGYLTTTSGGFEITEDGYIKL